MHRVHNFSAGPAILPLEVLQKAQEQLVDYQGSGSSIMEKSHRGAEYVEVHETAIEQLKQVLGLGDDFEVMFLQGGASTQFLSVPFNLLSENETADYINTGAWSKKAIKEADIIAFLVAHDEFKGLKINSNIKVLDFCGIKK